MNSREFLRAVVASHSIGLADKAAVIGVMTEQGTVVIVSCGESKDRKAVHKAIMMSHPDIYENSRVELKEEKE